MPSVPPTLKVGEIARACGVSRKRVMTELGHCGLLDRRGPGWRVSSSALRERLPDHFERVYAWFALGERPG